MNGWSDDDDEEETVFFEKVDHGAVSDNDDEVAASSRPLTSVKLVPPRQNIRGPSAALPSATPTTSMVFDPLSKAQFVMKGSLLDNGEDTDTDLDVSQHDSALFWIPGTAGFLEMESADDDDDEVRRNSARQHQQRRGPLMVAASSRHDEQDEPIRTSSGLLLTHRKSPTCSTVKGDCRQSPHGAARPHPNSGLSPMFASPGAEHSFYYSQYHKAQRVAARYRLFETEHPYSSSQHQQFLQHLHRILRLVKAWVWLSAVVLLLGTATLAHHIRHGDGSSNKAPSEHGVQSKPRTTVYLNANAAADAAEHVILKPLQPSPLPQQVSMHQNEHGRHRHLRDLRHDFEQWMKQHSKSYHSASEKERRFQIWTDNHHRTAAKNERHGKCQLTSQPVFGHNVFSDLTPAEFQAQYLTGYTGPRHDEPRARKVQATRVLDPDAAQPHHRRAAQMAVKMNDNDGRQHQPYGKNYYRCKWYDVSCNLNYLFDTYLYGFTGTMEPAYDANSYPTAVDWRDAGAVTSVRSQGSCGACWAITAVETIESAYFLQHGTLYDLSETEVIVCAEDCEMCSGGWPQDAFDYVKEHGGVPLQNDVGGFDGDWLLLVTKAVTGESDELSDNSVQNYKAKVCPAGNGNNKNNNNKGGNSKSGSQDNEGDEDYSSANVTPYNYARYGSIEGYGYATDRCVCYTDGSGCSCDSQDEGLAVRNLATYGPAVVCVDASLWQDYTGGVITSASGCSQEFMDVNHCVQAVGYAFASNSEEEDEDRHSGSGDRSGSGDDKSSRQGYWIVRNQWSKSWGYYGYAYVAMGDNTCGILNDMIQVYA